jgi:hypothetical protein
MLCALTHTGNTVWATFLPDFLGHTDMYLHTTPSLSHRASNVTLHDIDYSTVAKDLGILVTRHNFKERALGVWSFRGPMELKTLDELEGRVEGMWNNPIDLTDEDDGFEFDVRWSCVLVKYEMAGRGWVVGYKKGEEGGEGEEEVTPNRMRKSTVKPLNHRARSSLFDEPAIDLFRQASRRHGKHAVRKHLEDFF